MNCVLLYFPVTMYCPIIPFSHLAFRRIDIY